MIKFSHYKYSLDPVSVIGALAPQVPREGALLRCEWPDQKVGYADCFPWVEMGDADIDTQIYALSRGKISLLMEQTIWLARKDALMRSMHVNGLTGGAKIKSHYLVTDLSKLGDSELSNIKSAGFSTLKIKVGRNLEEEARQILRLTKLTQFMFRLDFNSKSDFSSFERFMTIFDKAAASRIEFVEDPFPYDEAAWTEASRMARLAVDFESENIDWAKIQKAPFEYLIIKPARQDVDKAIHRCTTHNLKAVVTSSLDHPVGVVHAAIVAAEIKKNYPSILMDCGILSLKVYRPNEFSNKIVTQGPYIVQTHGYGIGFDQVLPNLEWQPL